MRDEEVKHFFTKIMGQDEQVSAGIAAISTLLKFLENDKSETIQELESKMKEAVKAIRNTNNPNQITSVLSGSELFLRFITLATLDNISFAECKKVMLQRGEAFLNTLKEARRKVSKLASTFIIDGSKILTHSKSRVVLQTMKEAASANKRFEVYVTMSLPDNSGKKMAAELKKAGVQCTVILDSAVGYVMEKVDMVMVGAEGVAESGGIINKVGSYTVAICAREMKKPFYVLTESFKFSRIYPLNQRDLPHELKYMMGKEMDETPEALDNFMEQQQVDYTPPSYITLIFTDIGILTPSAVSDELIKLYL